MASCREYDRTFSYSEDRVEMKENFQSSDWGESSPFCCSRRESIFLAQSSSISFEERTCSMVFRASNDQETETRNTEDDSEYSENFDSLTASPKEDKKERKAQENFLRMKLAVLCKSQSNIIGDEKAKVSVPRKCSSNSSAVLVGGNRGKIEKLKIENLMSKMEKTKNKDFHDSKQCTDCRNMMFNVASRTWLKRKLEIAKRPELKGNLQIHLSQKDSATLIAEIANSCLKASTSPSDVWNRLLRKDTKSKLQSEKQNSFST